MGEKSLLYFAIAGTALLTLSGNLRAEADGEPEAFRFLSEALEADAPREQTAFGLPIRRWHLHLNGYSIHLHKPSASGKRPNDLLLGLGGAMEIETDGPWIWEIAADAFVDSRDELSAVLGPAFHYPVNDHFSAGGAVFLMYKQAFQDDYGFPILPVPLPFAEIGNEKVRLRTYYVPPVRRPGDHQVVFQVRIPF